MELCKEYDAMRQDTGEYLSARPRLLVWPAVTEQRQSDSWGMMGDGAAAALLVGTLTPSVQHSF